MNREDTTTRRMLLRALDLQRPWPDWPAEDEGFVLSTLPVNIEAMIYG